uniref:Uncharacterized protein n=1 Tax=Spongospora subterranea TaxID=70186 RepID=A0A0H5QTW8_9EUKA|eukprot:CRZ05453.1 hypothetical protein [Spongospora subterranea]
MRGRQDLICQGKNPIVTLVSRQDPILQGTSRVITLASLLGFLKKRELPVYGRCRKMLRSMRSKDGKDLRRQRKKMPRKLYMLAHLVVGIFWTLLKEVFMVLEREEAPQLRKVFVAEHIIHREQKLQKAMLFGDKMVEKINEVPAEFFHNESTLCNPNVFHFDHTVYLLSY